MAARLAALATLGALALTATPAAVAATATRSAVIAFVPRPLSPGALAHGRPLAIGLASASEGHFWPVQALLDVTQGSRIPAASQSPRTPPVLRLAGRRIVGWPVARRRGARTGDGLEPGLLASAIPGGAGYVGVSGASQLPAIVAADRAGRVAQVSLGSPATVVGRTLTLAQRRRLVVARLPSLVALDALLRRRPPAQLVVVLTGLAGPPGPARLEPIGIAGPPRSLTSASTHLPGVVVATDVAPTVLARLGLAIPGAVSGQPIRARGRRDPAALGRLAARLAVLEPRRLPTLVALVGAWAALLVGLGALRRRAGLALAARLGGLAILWMPSVLLAGAALAPGEAGELTLVAGGSFALAALTDRLIAWPRGPWAPCAVGLLAYAVDLARGSPLIVRSLLGPNPRSGARFYGIGNELEIVLAVLLVIGVAAALPRRRRSRAGAAAFALGGVVLAAVVGSGRLGADVGGVVTVAAGAAVAALAITPGRRSRRALALAVAAPLAALAALAALDLATGANGHFVRTVLRARGAGSLAHGLGRRYRLAYDTLANGVMPLLTALSVLAAAAAVRWRARLYAPLAGDDAWPAGLAGGLTAAVVGALVNDSGPTLLLFGVFGLGCVTAYLRGAPCAERAGRPAPAAAMPVRRAAGRV